MKRLRRRTYSLHDTLSEPAAEPYHFHAGVYRGAFPVVVFSSYRCDKYVMGLCSPCFYSGLQHSRAPRSEVYAALPRQAQAFLDRFDSLVAASQPGRGQELPYVVQIAGEGSFLRDGEIPPQRRQEILRMFAEDADQRGIAVSYNLETKAEDIVNAERTGEFRRLGALRERLQLSVAIGYEAADPFVRNVVFAKQLDENVFQEAVGIAKRWGMTPIAYVYGGGHGMTDQEIVASVGETVAHLRRLGVGIYLMIPNLQPFTLSHLLWESGRHRLPDANTIVELLLTLLRSAPTREVPHAWLGVSDWMIGGITATPEPALTFYSSIPDVRIRDCLERVIDALQKEQDATAFKGSVRELGLSGGYGGLEAEGSDRHVRVARALDEAESLIDSYLARQSRLAGTGPGAH